MYRVQRDTTHRHKVGKRQDEIAMENEVTVFDKMKMNARLLKPGHFAPEKRPSQECFIFGNRWISM